MIIIIGKSGSGKSTILNELLKRGFKKPINHTTRKKRPSDKTEEYIFLSKEEFDNMWNEGKLLQRAVYDGEYYGTSIEVLGNEYAAIMISESIRDVKNKIKELGKKDVRVTSFYIKIEEEERIARLKKRGDLELDIKKRFEEDEKRFKDSENLVDYVIVNDNLDRAVNEIIRKTKNIKNILN